MVSIATTVLWLEARCYLHILDTFNMVVYSQILYKYDLNATDDSLTWHHHLLNIWSRYIKRLPISSLVRSWLQNVAWRQEMLLGCAWFAIFVWYSKFPW